MASVRMVSVCMQDDLYPANTSQGNWHSSLVIDLCVQNLWSLDRRNTYIVISCYSYVADGGTGTGLTGEQRTQGESL